MKMYATRTSIPVCMIDLLISLLLRVVFLKYCMVHRAFGLIFPPYGFEQYAKVYPVFIIVIIECVISSLISQ